MIKRKAQKLPVMIHQCMGDLAALQPVTSASPNLQRLLK